MITGNTLIAVKDKRKVVSVEDLSKEGLPFTGFCMDHHGDFQICTCKAFEVDVMDTDCFETFLGGKIACTEHQVFYDKWKFERKAIRMLGIPLFSFNFTALMKDHYRADRSFSFCSRSFNLVKQKVYDIQVQGPFKNYVVILPDIGWIDLTKGITLKSSYNE